MNEARQRRADSHKPGSDAARNGPINPCNLIGGSLFVAVLNYAHIRETRK